MCIKNFGTPYKCVQKILVQFTTVYSLIKYTNLSKVLGQLFFVKFIYKFQGRIITQRII